MTNASEELIYVERKVRRNNEISNNFLCCSIAAVPNHFLGHFPLWKTDSIYSPPPSILYKTFKITWPCN